MSEVKVGQVIADHRNPLLPDVHPFLDERVVQPFPNLRLPCLVPHLTLKVGRRDNTSPEGLFAHPLADLT